MKATALTEATAATPTSRTARTATSRIPEPPRREHLAGLVGGEALDRFLDHHQGRDAFRRRLPQGVAAGLFGWPQLNAALAEHRLTSPRLRLEMAGADATAGLFKDRRTRRGRVLQDLDTAILNARLQAGATLVLDAANELSPSLQRLCAGLGAEFAASCQANVYACWGSTQGFDVHWDDHDVFVIQVEGRKRWALYGATRAAPSYRERTDEHPKPVTPREEIVLEPGDLLYLPRGYWHAAVGLGEPTLHLTIGLTRKTGADFLHWLADEALSDAQVRADLPLESDDETLGRHLTEIMAARLNPAGATELGRRYRRHVQATTAQRPELSFPFIGSDPEVYAPETSITLAQGPCSLTPGQGGSAVVLRHRGVDYTVAAELHEPLAALVAGETIRYGDFQQATSQKAGPLVGGFVREMAARGVFVLSA